MSEPTQPLPSGWTAFPIEELFQPLADGRKLHHGWSPQCDKQPAGDGEWGVLKTTAVQDGAFLPEHNKHLPPKLKPRAQFEVKQGDLLITCAGPRVRCGVPCLVRETRNRLILSGKMYRFRVRPEIIDSRYMEAYLRSPETQRLIDKMKTGISDSGLNLTHGRFFTLQVPVAPPAEQSRIVAKIEELFSDLDAGVAALERVRVNLKRYRAAVLKAAVEGHLTEEWRTRHPATEPAAKLLERILAERRAKWEQDQLRKFKEAGKTPPKGWKEKYKQPPPAETKDLATPPPSWCWASIEQLSTKVVDGVHRKPHYIAAGVPFVTVRNLTAGPGISFEKLNYVSEADHTEFSRRTDVQRGDILISKDGTLGVVRVVRTDTVFSIFVSVALVKPVNYEYSDYLGLAMSSLPVQRQMVPKGSGLQHIHLEDLRCDAVPLAPLAEQAEIVAEVDRRLSVTDAAETQVEHALQRAARLRQAILKRAFEGKLVPQDPTDEPAAALLERIKPATNGKHPAPAKPPMRRSRARV